jgi:hypothetical protein
MKYTIPFLITALVLIFLLILSRKTRILDHYRGWGRGRGRGRERGYPYWAHPNCNRDRVIANCMDECKKDEQQCKDCFKTHC